MLLAAIALQSSSQGEWLTHYEKSGYVETSRYAEDVEFCRRLDAASPDAKMIVYGKSPEGRDMVALIISAEHAFTPKAAAKSMKPLIFVQNGIHSGEIEGKDASLTLARDILIRKRHRDLLAGTNLIVVPVFSVDAHERFTPYGRINQNGPQSMGWRATAQNLNLNRDYIKSDGGEMQNQIRLLHAWKPDFFFDNHTTDGGDWNYMILLALPMAQTQNTPAAEWSRKLYGTLVQKLGAKGYNTGPYFDLEDPSKPERGLSVGDYGPRYSTGYLAAMNRPSMLIETHVLKPYRARVESTYWAMVYAMQQCIEDTAALKSMNREADESERRGGEGNKVVLAASVRTEKKPYTFKAYTYTPYQSEVSGSTINHWETSKPVDVFTTIQDTYEPSVTVTLPAAYAIPPQWKNVHDLLRLHGLDGFEVNRPVKKVFNTYRFTDVKFDSGSYEARFMPSYKAVPIAEERTLLPGTMVYPTNQVGAKLLAHILDPNGPDSLAKWGCFNVMFEGKEYFEDYAMEPVAKKMLDSDPKLKAEFEEKLKDEKFAKDSRARLEFFYERSPYYDVWHNKYPIVQLTSKQVALIGSK
jgi:hypothetical protein